MIIGVATERYDGETRVALTPALIKPLLKAGLEVRIEGGAGESAGFGDDDYIKQGASIVGSRRELFAAADVLLAVRAAAADPDNSDAAHLREGQTIIGFLEPYQPHATFREYLDKRISSLSMELIPRISRAQSMDALSSMANLAGYRSVLMAAQELPKLIPMMMTAAGTIVAAKIFIVGVGVAGLQAIATAHRLGAVVSAYDVRPEVKEQVESLGARFFELGLQAASGEGGYAADMDAEFYRQQQERMAEKIGESDVVITTAAVPGKPAPKLITAAMVAGMRPGSVIVDLAAERGGNCEITAPGQTIVRNGVTIIGLRNIAARMPRDASQLYGRNLSSLVLSMVREGRLHVDQEDEVIAAALVTHAGAIPNEKIRQQLQL